MKTAKLDLTVSRTNHGKIRIQIEDYVSGDKLLIGEMECEDFAKAITGLSNQPLYAEVNDACHIGMERETKGVEFNMDRGNSKEEAKRLVLNDFAEKYANDGWIMQSDGTRSQQNKIGKHQYIIKRYAEPDNEHTAKNNSF